MSVLKSERDDYFRQCGDIEKGFNEMMLERDYLARRCDELLLALKQIDSEFISAPQRVKEIAKSAINKGVGKQ